MAARPMSTAWCCSAAGTTFCGTAGGSTSATCARPGCACLSRARPRSTEHRRSKMPRAWPRVTVCSTTPSPRSRAELGVVVGTADPTVGGRRVRVCAVSQRDVLRAVLGQAELWWSTNFRPRLDRLTDDEFLWEPAADCWTLHPTDTGGVTSDFAWPPPSPSPVTTIAWRLCHVGVGCLANRTSVLYPEFAPEPLT